MFKFFLQAFYTLSVVHRNNALYNRHKNLQVTNKQATLPPCYHIGGSHIKEQLPIIEANNVTGKEMILGMLQYIWPKVGCFFKPLGAIYLNKIFIYIYIG